MFPFIILFILCITSSLFKKYEFSSYFILVILFIFSFFRADTIGTDTLNYMDEQNLNLITNLDFENFDWKKANRYIELSYLFIVNVAVFFNNPRIIISCFTILTFVFLFKTFKINQINIGIGFTLFLLFQMFAESLNIARQITACSIISYAISLYIRDGNKKKCICWLLLAISFHFSSIVSLVLLVIPNFSISLSKALSILLTILFLVNLLPVDVLIGKILGSDLLPYFKTYQFLIDETQVRSLNGMIYQLLSNLFLVYIFLATVKGKSLVQLDILFLISFILVILFTNASEVLGRIVIPFRFIILIYAAQFFTRTPLAVPQNFLLYILFCCLFGYSSFTAIERGAGELIPYHFINLSEFNLIFG